MIVLIDTREQKPVLFDKVGHQNFPELSAVEFATLTTGDYSVKGFEYPEQGDSITIERKSLSDLFSSTGRGRDRLEQEFIRMSQFSHASFVIESDFRTIFKSPPQTSQMNPRAVYRTIIAFCQRYRVSCWPCPTRSFAEKTTYILLHRFWSDRQPGGKLYGKD
jgi:ERCC4-type nuclease